MVGQEGFARNFLSWWLVVAWLGLGASSAAPADGGYGDYEQGLRQLGYGHLEEALNLLTATAARRPEASASLVTRPYGMRFEPYLPHFYLGLCQCRLGDFAAALAAWREADRQAVVAQSPAATGLLAERRQCEETLLPEIRQRLEQARSTARRQLDRLEDRWRVSSARWPVDQVARRAQLRAAFDRLTDQALAASELSRLAQALPELVQLQQQANQLRDQVEAALLQEVEALQSQVAAAGRQLAELAEQSRQHFASDQLPLPSSLVQELTTAITRADRLTTHPRPSVNTASELEAELQRINASHSQLEQLRGQTQDRRLPTGLMALASAYFEGRYDSLLARADSADFERPRSRAQARLFAAAAHFALAQLRPAESSKRLASAQRLAAASFAADPDLRPQGPYFPPGFRSFFAASLDH